MKKFIFLFIMVLSAFVLTSCKEEGEYAIAMVTDLGDIDDRSFNQGTWEGIKKYAEEYGIPHKYYKPTSKDTDAYVAAIELAISNGAKIVITPGYLFEEAINICQAQYPNTKFVIIDGNPANVNAFDEDPDNNGTLMDNTYSIFFAEEQVGYLAGYAAVKEGHTNLGFMGGMAVPAVIRYGQGFIFGANAAAIEDNKDITIKYHYTGDFQANSRNQSTSATMYSDGVSIIFACGGSVGNSVMAAAAVDNKLVIGVDVDQSQESPTVITSATKGIGIAAYTALESFFGGDWDEEAGGLSVTLDAAKDGVGLVMNENAKFNIFTKAQYDAVFKDLVDGKIVIPFDLTKANKENELIVSKVTVTVVA